MERPIYKDCGKSFIPLIEEVLSRLPEKEKFWIERNVRFTQRSPIQKTLDHWALLMENESENSDFYNKVETEYHKVWEQINKPAGTAWKHGRYHYIRLNPVILQYEDQEEALGTVAHELGHCFNWVPAKQRRARTMGEQLADKWAIERGFKVVSRKGR